MVQRTLVSVIAIVISFGLASSAGADPAIRIRPVGTTNAGTARFLIENATADTLVFATYDGGQLHNGLERLEQGRWVGEALGYCGLGVDDRPVTIAAGARHTVSAFVGRTSGTYRIRVQLTRQRDDGTALEEEILSEPIQVR